MRIKTLTIDNFRGYETESGDPFVLNIEKKPIVLIYGNNGLGKSSLYDAIEWGVTGKVERYDGSSAEKNGYYILKNHFSQRKQGYVELEFDDGFKIKRNLKFNGGKSDYNIGELSYGHDKKTLANLLVNETFQNKIELERHFNVSHLLSQELLNNFIKGKSETERYETFLSLYGLNQDNNQKEKIDKNIKEVSEIAKDISNKIMKVDTRILEYKKELNSSSNNSEREILERKIENIVKEKDISLEKLGLLYNEFNENKMNALILVKKFEEKKKILLNRENFEEANKELEKLRIQNTKLSDTVKSFEKYEFIEIIEKNKDDYLKYLIKSKEKEKKNQEQLKINRKISELKNLEKNSEILEFYKIDEFEQSQNYIQNRDFSNKIKKEIEEIKYIIAQIEEVREAFILTSKNLLEKTYFDECPLCGNEIFFQEDIKKKLKKELENQINPLTKNYLDDVYIKELKIKELDQTNEDIIRTLKMKVKGEIEYLLKKKLELDKYFEELELLETPSDNVKKSLEYLNIEFSEYEQERLVIMDKLKTNLESKKNISRKIFEVKERILKLDSQELKLFNELVLSGITLKYTEEEIRKNIEINIVNEELVTNILKLRIIYENDKTLIKIKDENEKKEELNNKLIKINKCIEDLDELKNILDKKILDEVKDKSEIYEEKIQLFYQLLMPHKKFDKMKISVDEKKGKYKNILRVEVYGNTNDDRKNNPAFIFSSAQTNVLAIAIFLTFALDSKWSKLNTILLDDPIQNMDDINVYNFVDLIKRVSENKQVILSTHDDRIRDFMIMKFGEENVQVVEFESYGKVIK